MIEKIIYPYISERFLSDARYREGHLRVINALPRRKVMGLHTPDMKQLARNLYLEHGKSIILRFENENPGSLSYEETMIWGFMINMHKCDVDEHFEMVAHFVPVIDNWAVCDAFCANAKWMAKIDRGSLWNFLLPYFASSREFEVRFAIVVSMCYLLHEDSLPTLFDKLGSLNFSSIKSEYITKKGRPDVAQQGYVQGAEPYYVRMAVAWLLATSLAKFPSLTREYVRSSHLPDDVVRLYVRKARESFRTKFVEAL